MNLFISKQKKSRISYRTKRGFTLIEMLLYIGLLVIIVTAVSTLFSVVVQSRVKNESIQEVEQQGNQAMQTITQSIHNALSITAPLVAATSSSLTLKFDSTINPILNPTVFSISGGQLSITEGASAAVPLTTSRVTISNLIFQNISKATTPGIIRIQFTVTYNSSSTLNEYTYSKTFYNSASVRNVYFK